MSIILAKVAGTGMYEVPECVFISISEERIRETLLLMEEIAKRKWRSVVVDVPDVEWMDRVPEEYEYLDGEEVVVVHTFPEDGDWRGYWGLNVHGDYVTIAGWEKYTGVFIESTGISRRFLEDIVNE